jgi:hypothetical protein
MKKYLFGFFAIVIAISLSAFTISEKAEKKATDRYWVINEAGTHYVEFTAGVPSEGNCFDSADDRCIIMAEDQPLYDETFLVEDRDTEAPLAVDVSTSNGKYSLD